VSTNATGGWFAWVREATQQDTQPETGDQTVSTDTDTDTDETTRQELLHHTADVVTSERCEDAEFLALALEHEDEDEAELIADDLAGAFLEALLPLTTDEDRAHREDWAQTLASAAFWALRPLTGEDGAQEVADRIAREVADEDTDL